MESYIEYLLKTHKYWVFTDWTQDISSHLNTVAVFFGQIWRTWEKWGKWTTKRRMLKHSIALVLRLSGLVNEKLQLIIHLHHRNISNTCRWNYTAKLGAKLFVKPMPGICAVLTSSDDILRIWELLVIFITYSSVS